MTLQLRPTFSESWYRVKDLRPRLRAAAQISRQYYRGERWYVVRDPAGNQFHRLSDVAYRFVGLLDGTRTVGEAWELVGGQLADDAPTQPEIIQILTQLYSANLIETNVTPDAQVLLRRHKKQRERKVQQRLMNVLFPRLPLWDPDRFLKAWMPLVGPMISKIGMLFWLATVGFALFLVIPRLEEFGLQTQDLISSQRMEMWLLLGVTFIVVKFFHEMGHAFTCRRFGGEVHEVGIMFLVLMPCPYVDASSAWAFPNKWKRILVGAGGMLAELFIAAIAAVVWANTSPETWQNQLAYYVILIASVSTVLFNANPLLRYDGYYILSDWLEIPNLQFRSREYTLGLIKRHLFRVRSTQPLPATIRQRLWLVVYSITSTIYRIFISIAIMLMVLYNLPEALKIVGLIMAAGAIATFFVVPVFKLFKYLTTDPELHRKRTRAWAWTLAAAGLLVVGLGLIQVPSYVRAEGISEPIVRQQVVTTTPGWVEEVLVTDGEPVEAGQTLVRLRNEELESRIAKAQAELRRAELEANAAAARSGAEYGIAMQSVELAQERLAKLQRDQEQLELRAPVAGTFISPEYDRLPGRYLERNDLIGRIDDTQTLEIFVAVPQDDYERVVQHLDKVDVQVRMSGDVLQVLEGKVENAGPMATNRVRSAALTQSGGGMLASAGGRDPRQTASSQFELLVSVDNENNAYMPNQRTFVRLALEDEPLAKQWYRSFLQLIQSQRTPQIATAQ